MRKFLCKATGAVLTPASEAAAIMLTAQSAAYTPMPPENTPTKNLLMPADTPPENAPTKNLLMPADTPPENAPTKTGGLAEKRRASGAKPKSSTKPKSGGAK